MVHMQTAPIKRCQMRASARHKSNSIVALPTLHKQQCQGGKKKKKKELHKAVQSSRQCPKFSTTLQEKKSPNKVASQVAYFFLASLLFPHALLARHLCPAHGATATAQCAVIWSVLFFSFAFFRSSFWWRGSASFVNTLPAVVSTRWWWFPFVAFRLWMFTKHVHVVRCQRDKKTTRRSGEKNCLQGDGWGTTGVGVCQNGKEHPGRGGRQKCTGRRHAQPLLFSQSHQK